MLLFGMEQIYCISISKDKTRFLFGKTGEMLVPNLKANSVLILLGYYILHTIWGARMA